MSLLAGWLNGCASSAGPDVLAIAAGDYGQAFDAAVEAARAEGLPPELLDRRGGIVTTIPSIAGSAIEPWRGGNASFEHSLENTLSFQRRRARFEFVPAGFQPPDGPEEDLAGPEHFAARAPLDLTAAGRPIELRVWVYLEQAHAPGVRRSTWSRSLTTRAQLIVPEGERALPDEVFWTPVARDRAFERRLLAEVASRLREGEFAAEAGAAGMAGSQPSP